MFAKNETTYIDLNKYIWMVTTHLWQVGMVYYCFTQ